MANNTAATDDTPKSNVSSTAARSKKAAKPEQWTVDGLQRLAVDTFRMHAPLLLINYLATKYGFELLQTLLILVRPDRLFPKLFATEEMYNLNAAWTQYVHRVPPYTAHCSSGPNRSSAPWKDARTTSPQWPLALTSLMRKKHCSCGSHWACWPYSAA